MGRKDGPLRRGRSAALWSVAAGIAALLVLSAAYTALKASSQQEGDASWLDTVMGGSGRQLAGLAASAGASGSWLFPGRGGGSFNATSLGNEMCDCGIWQAWYARLHAAMLAGRAPKRFVAVTCSSGMGGCMKGAVTMLYYALLSGRAFLMHAPDGYRFEAAFAAPAINWTFDASRFDLLDASRTKSFSGPNAKKNALLSALQSGNLREFEKDTELLHVDLSTGRLLDLMDNPYHRHELYAMGLIPETAFGCGMDFLVSPTPALKSKFEREAAILGVAKRPNSANLSPGTNPTANPTKTVAIGVHLRAGRADALPPGAAAAAPKLKDFAAFFKCAEELEEAQAKAGQKVVWYVISDDIKLRKAAKKKYGEKVLTTTADIVLQTGALPAGKAKGDAPMLAAAGEMWLFAQADYHVIGLHSAFGHVGPLWARRSHSIFGLDNSMPAGEKREAPCQPRFAQPLEYLAPI